MIRYQFKSQLFTFLIDYLKIISETGKSLPPNQMGELCIKSKSIFQSYHNNPEATSATLDSKVGIDNLVMGF